MNVGDSVMVPRTGGGYSKGKILEVCQDRAYVTFPVGETFRGNPIDPEMKGRMAYKDVAIKNLLPVDKEEM